jgi:hypothetical protein
MHEIFPLFLPRRISVCYSSGDLSYEDEVLRDIMWNNNEWIFHPLREKRYRGISHRHLSLARIFGSQKPVDHLRGAWLKTVLVSLKVDLFSDEGEAEPSVLLGDIGAKITLT